MAMAERVSARIAPLQAAPLPTSLEQGAFVLKLVAEEHPLGVAKVVQLACPAGRTASGRHKSTQRR